MVMKVYFTLSRASGLQFSVMPKTKFLTPLQRVQRILNTVNTALLIIVTWSFNCLLIIIIISDLKLLGEQMIIIR